ncbi:hypothetical protein CY34DRAFT_379720 [Suillus luteus UH-Slu-Lm8-n1]|uniref:Uncharacterized protein n=1 Tax=Suillus luteus UH-Slu-Lm8-n1 TaxID=930992 RepID=A0A0D0BL32_9AGAM|nr:hypothetical protein CY34DRAFT_379720 [Suillus luteus UH-Slu-Lm8-n1]
MSLRMTRGPCYFPLCLMMIFLGNPLLCCAEQKGKIYALIRRAAIARMCFSRQT